VHWFGFALALKSPGQVSVQTVDAPATVTEVVAVLSAARASFVSLEIFATLVMTVPFAVPAFTFRANEKIAIALAGKVAIVQVNVPVPPTGGSTHVKVRP
jgi:hypothetical protein